jgi:hypothetical protein
MMTLYHFGIIMLIVLALSLGFLLGFDFCKYGYKKGWDKK